MIKAIVHWISFRMRSYHWNMLMEYDRIEKMSRSDIEKRRESDRVRQQRHRAKDGE